MNNPQRNVKLYSWYYALTSFLAWMPIFFLYFNSLIDLSDVLLLESVYYISVVILEVPSGYFSDAMGRKRTLVVGALFLCIAAMLYASGASFYSLVIAQVCFAGHMAFVSGTNTVFHYESLKAIGKEDDYGAREAVVNKWALISAGISALIGGWIANWDMRYAYYLTFATALISLIIAFSFSEPEKQTKASSNFISQLKATILNLKKGTIAWIFSYYIVMYMLAHIPYEFYQPYLDLLGKNDLFDTIPPMTLSGLLYAGVAFLAAFASSRSIRWKNVIGLKNYLMLMMVLMFAIVGLMGWFFHPVLIVVILFRGFGWSAIKPPINEQITPNIAAGQRATFHSILSLVCRLSFFGLLIFLSTIIPSGAESSWPQLSHILKVCFGITAMLAIPILITMNKANFVNAE